jgi:hypothetical protein
MIVFLKKSLMLAENTGQGYIQKQLFMHNFQIYRNKYRKVEELVR